MNDELKLHTLLSALPFYVTPPHPCSYLDDRQATTVFVDPAFTLTMQQYSQLANLGFRRSGEHVYRPECTHCRLCIPVRIPVNEFRPNRSQRRCLRRNEDLNINMVDAVFRQEHFALYRRYMSSRHAGGGMDKDDPEAYQSLIAANWCDSSLIEFRLQQELVAVAVLDRFLQGMSAVYTFFDPDYAERSLGIYAILQQIEEACRLGRKWLYLGYWIHDCDKMRYKTAFSPMEAYLDSSWTRFETAQKLPLRYNGNLPKAP